MTDTASLEDGFYWVRHSDLWEVALINGPVAYLVGINMPVMTTGLREIDTRPIKREPPA